MEDFLKTWEEEYKEKASKIAIFTDKAKQLTLSQKQLFIRLFYHARGHFGRFLWIMASTAPDFEYRSIVIENINDELGGMGATHVSHEQLFTRFAEGLNVDVLAEEISEENYLPFLKEFNKGHINALLKGNWDEKWSVFSAYELLDNTDYNNLFILATKMGLSGDALTFFEVHKDGDHFGKTFQLLKKIWEKDEELVKKSFLFIGNHQLKMWNSLNDQVFA